jgi:hypothetical protein
MNRRTGERNGMGARLLPAAALLLALSVTQGCAKDRAKVTADSAGLQASGGVRADSGAVPMRVSDGPVMPPRPDGGRDAQPLTPGMPDDPSAGVVDDDDEMPLAQMDSDEGDRYDRGDRHDRGRGWRHGRHGKRGKAKH